MSMSPDGEGFISQLNTFTMSSSSTDSKSNAPMPSITPYTPRTPPLYVDRKAVYAIDASSPLADLSLRKVHPLLSRKM